MCVTLEVLVRLLGLRSGASSGTRRLALRCGLRRLPECSPGWLRRSLCTPRLRAGLIGLCLVAVRGGWRGRVRLRGRSRHARRGPGCRRCRGLSGALGLGCGEGRTQERSRRGRVPRKCGRSRARGVRGMSPRGGRTRAARPAVTGPRGGGRGRLTAEWPAAPCLPVVGDGPCVCLCPACTARCW